MSVGASRPIWKFIFPSFGILILSFVVIANFKGRLFLSTIGGKDLLPIGMVLKATENPFWKEVKEGATLEAKKNHVDLAVNSTVNEWEYEEQIRMVRSFFDRGIKALILAPNDLKRLVPVIREANQKNIPVIIIDIPISDEELKQQKISILSQICSDNEKGGRLAAQFVAKKYDHPTRVGLLTGRDPVGTYTNSRENGFSEELKKYSTLQLTHRGHGDWSRERAKTLTESWLKDQFPPDVIFAASDFMALGVLDAVQSAKYSGELRVIGYDATREGQRAILDDRLLASISQDPMKMGQLAVEFAAKYLRGNLVPAKAFTPVTIVFGVRELRSTETVVN